MVSQLSLDQLFSTARQTFGFRTFATQENFFADVTGFHIYGDIRLALALAAAKDDKNSQFYLELLEDYALVADASAQEVDAKVLEVQGERIHLFLPASAVDNQSLRRLFRLSVSLTRAVYDQVSVKAGDHFQGFRMAADHGRAIIVATGREGDDSLISLGNAANSPAKRIARHGVESGKLAIPYRFVEEAGLFTGERIVDTNRTWIEVNVYDPPQYLQEVIDDSLTDRIEKRAAANIQARETYARPQQMVAAVNAKYFTANVSNSVDQPLKVQGLCLRADLDGFTNQVALAFAAGERGVKHLVERFVEIMTYPEQFAKVLNRKVISLPWAGDCATQIIPLNPGESYSEVRRLLMGTAPLKWHDAYAEQNADETKRKAIRTALEDAQWAVGIAGGDDVEHDGGFILLATISTSSRRYTIGAGWGVRRSLDAQQAKGIAAEHSVVHYDDYSALDPEFRSAFTSWPESTIFRRATAVGLRAATKRIAAREAEPKEIAMPNIRIAPALLPIPASRPYHR